MSPPSSKSTAPLSLERPQLAPTWLIVLLAVVICLGLWLLYPRQDLEKRLLQTAETELANSYLHNLLRSDPNNPRLRLLLARREIAHGDTINARVTLQVALQSNDPELRRQALWVQWELLHYEYWHIPKDAQEASQRQGQKQLLRQHIRTLAQHEWPPEQQLELAGLASQFDETAIALALMQKQAPAEEPLQGALFYQRAAQQALAQGNYAHCAQLYIAARYSATDPSQAKAYYYAAVAALQSGNQPAAALLLAEQEIGPWADDTETLFMVTQLARAAARPDVAQTYVRRLLHMALWQASQSWRSAQFDDGAHLLIHPALQGATTVADKPTPAKAPHLPALAFDEKTYNLGYEVFLDNQNLEDAWAVANAAVLQQPKDMRWRERLASVSEWTQRLPIALTHWVVLAKETNQEKAWQAILRLAPGLFDEDALVLALRHQLSQRPDDETLVRAFVAAQERTGEPRPALDYLRQHAQSPATVELLAQLAERMGESTLALQTWEKLLAQPEQMTAARAMHAAVLAMSLNRADLGLQWLEAAQNLPIAPREEAQLWRLTADIAQRQESYALAVQAYRKLVHTPDASLGDYDALIRLLLNAHPVQAAQVALQAWQRFDEPRHILQALMIYAGRNQWDDFARALSLFEVDSEAPHHSLAQMRRSPDFLRLMGTYHQNTGQPMKARAYYEAGLKVAPDSADMRQALLWLFIDGNDATAVKQLLALHEAQWRMQEEIHDALAAAYQALSQPQVALDRYLTPRLMAHQHDFLWLMNYADALDQNQQSERAWQMRRRLLSRQWQDAQEGRPPRLTPTQARAQWLSQEGLDATRRIARARLILTQQPGDAAQNVLRELLRLDMDQNHQSKDQEGKDKGASSSYSNAAAETAIGWFQDAGEYSAERGFLWHQYARSRSTPSNQPLWAEITVALAEDDRAATGQLLQRFDERLPRYDRVNAAAAVGDVRLAQTAAFDAQTAQVEDHSTHLQLTQNLLAFSDHAYWRLQMSDLGAIDETQAQMVWHAALNPRWSIHFELDDIRRHVKAPQLLRQSVNEQAAAVMLRWKHPNGQSQLRSSLRQGYRTTTPLHLEHEHFLDRNLLLRGEFGWQLPSEDSLALRLGGMKTRLAGHLRYQATRQDSVLLSQWGELYHLQSGAQVGSASRSAIEYSHTYRLEAPLIQFGAFWSSHRFDRFRPSRLGGEGIDFQNQFLPVAVNEIGRDYFLPTQFQLYGLRLSTNMQFEHDYTQALRPYASVSRTWHSLLGPGYDLRLGVAGNLLGADHLSVNFGLGKSGVESMSLSRSLYVSYRIHF